MIPVTITHRPAMKGAHYSAREWVGLVLKTNPLFYGLFVLHTTDPHPNITLAQESARAWAIENGYTIKGEQS